MSSNIIDFGKKVIGQEAQAIGSLIERIDETFVQAVKLILNIQPAGRVVISGIGKPALIARKISATLASTGTTSYFLHPADAIHGDLGRVRKQDVMVLLSNSGESQEIISLLNILKKIGTPIIAITGNADSTLANYSDVVLCMGAMDEACPMGLAPSVTTTAMLALGDALALTVLDQKDFGPEDYALYHPGGALGRKLMKVHEAMRSGDRNPVVRGNESVEQVIVKVTGARSGAACIIDDHGALLGIFTDGDLRRSLKGGTQVLKQKVGEVMTARPVTIHCDALCTEAAKLLREKHIDELPVVDDSGTVVGILDIQDLLAIGLL